MPATLFSTELAKTAFRLFGIIQRRITEAVNDVTRISLLVISVPPPQLREVDESCDAREDEERSCSSFFF